jgi:iron complex transport system substrate-binding protein
MNRNRDETDIGPERRGDKISRLRTLFCLAGVLILLLGVIAAGGRRAASAVNASGRVVIDMAGRTVRLPDQLHRVSCNEVLCYEKFFLLGASRLVASMRRTDPPWMSTIDPHVDRVAKVDTDPNREDLLAEGDDVVLMRYNALELRGLTSAGIPAIVSQPPLRTHFKDAAAFADAQKRMVRLLASIIGGDAVRKAEEWCGYYDERISYVTARTAGIPEAGRLRAYYLRGPSATTTQGATSNTYWYGVIAGAEMIAKDLDFDAGPMSMEEIIGRDPAFIFVGRQYSPDLVLRDPHWRDISAVKNARVIPLPAGMFYWDGGTESFLLAELIAKTLYPDRFADLNMAEEVRRYYKMFYNFDFTDDEIDKFLRGMTPAGIRRNY